MALDQAATTPIWQTWETTKTALMESYGFSSTRATRLLRTAQKVWSSPSINDINGGQNQLLYSPWEGDTQFAIVTRSSSKSGVHDG
jgi:hypothetical protein